MNLPLAADAPNDFDFILGSWQVRHRRLDARLCGCDQWTEFDGLSTTTRTLGGYGNVEDNILHLPGETVRAAAFRSFDRSTGNWAIWWLDGRSPHLLDVPVVGRFVDSVGEFYANDTFEGRPIRVRFIWRAHPGGQPTWEQAFSDDDGRNWETNWTMTFSPVCGLERV